MSQYFPESFENSNGNSKVELDLFNYTTNVKLRRATSIDTTPPVSKTDLNSLKTEVNRSR